MRISYWSSDVCSSDLNRIGKHRALMLGSAGFASYMLLMLLMPPGSLWFFGLAAIWGGAMACAADMLPRSMMADVSDEDQLESGQDRTGMLFALLTDRKSTRLNSSH